MTQLTPKFTAELANCTRRRRPTRLWPPTAARRDGAERVSRGEFAMLQRKHSVRVHTTGGGARTRLHLNSTGNNEWSSQVTSGEVRSLVDDVRACRRITGNPSTRFEELFQFLFLPLATIIFLLVFTDKNSNKNFPWTLNENSMTLPQPTNKEFTYLKAICNIASYIIVQRLLKTGNCGEICR